MTEARRLAGIAFTGYRSFAGEALQRVAPMRKVHLVAGPNNSGKSNILRATAAATAALREHRAWALEFEDVPVDRDDAPALRVAIAVDADAQRLQALFPGVHGLADSLLPLFDEAAFRDGVSELLWFEYEHALDVNERAAGWRIADRQVRALQARTFNPDRNWISNLSSHLVRTGGGNPGDDERRILEHAANSLAAVSGLPEVVTLNPLRQITPEVMTEGEYGGAGLIDRLARLQGPSIQERGARARFEAVRDFVRTVLEDPAADIDVPYGRDTIIITHGGRELPLENLGTGLHQVIVLAVAATVLSDRLVCIEEPEVHLHPVLQRRLLAYLSERTDNQYLIATHSAHLLDAARASISAVRLHEGQSVVAPAVRPEEVAAISLDLGLRASDLVQSNAVAWVEGPSDRILLAGWIRMFAPELVEGIHFSVMFYGGRLLNHLSPEDQPVTDFISLPRLNRNLAVVIDSDRTNARQKLNATKQRVRRSIETSDANSAVWVTHGYTIENYVPVDVLRAAMTHVHPKSDLRWDGDRFSNPFSAHNLFGVKAPDKVRIAQRVLEIAPGLTAYPRPLHKSIEAVVRVIYRANDLSSPQPQ